MKSIQQMKAEDSIQQFFLIKSADCKTAANGKKYLDFVLADATGEINGKLWECNNGEESQYQPQLLVKVKGTVGEWQGKLQLRVEKIRPANDEDKVKVEDFVPVAPVSPEFMYGELEGYISRIANPDILAIVRYLVDENKDKLLYYPAAKQNHHSVRSGLLYHVTTMLKLGEKISQIYPLLNPDLLFAGIILHDLAKLAEMDAGDLGIVSQYTVEGELLGHIIQGIKWIDRAAREVGAAEEVSILLQHMILSHHYEPEFGSPKRPMIPEGEILHYLDLMDARMYDMGRVLQGVEPGQLSDKVWLLHNRKLYKAKCNTADEE